MLQSIGIICLLLVHACDCTNSNQAQPHTDNLPEHNTPVTGRIHMQVTPTKLRGEEKQVQIIFTIPDDMSVSKFKNCKLKGTYAPATPTSFNEISYVDATGTPRTQAHINEKLSHFITDIPSTGSKSYTLLFTLKPASEAIHLVINFELFDNEDKFLLRDQATWKDEALNLEIELQGKSKLIEDERDFSLKITNTGPKSTVSNQLKLMITRINGQDATVGIDDQNNRLQEIDLEELQVNASITKKFKIYPNSDTKAAFSFQLMYIGEPEKDPIPIAWQESWLEISQLYYCRGTNQVFYQVSNHGSLEKDAVELVYKNLSNNRVTLASLTDQSIALGNLGSLSHPYSGLQVNFNGEAGAEFEFKLMDKGKVVETKTINLKNIKLRMEGIRDGQEFRGQSQLKFYVKNMSSFPVDVEDIYIQCTSSNGVSFKWHNNQDVNIAASLASYAGKKIVQAGEKLPLQLELQDAHGQIDSSIILELQERCGNQISVLTETALNWRN